LLFGHIHRQVIFLRTFSDFDYNILLYTCIMATATTSLNTFYENVRIYQYMSKLPIYARNTCQAYIYIERTTLASHDTFKRLLHIIIILRGFDCVRIFIQNFSNTHDKYKIMYTSCVHSRYQLCDITILSILAAFLKWATWIIIYRKTITELCIALYIYINILNTVYDKAMGNMAEWLFTI